MQIKLQTKVFFMLFVTTTIFLSVLYAISSFILLHGFVMIEDQQITRNTERLQEIIIDDEETLKSTTLAWSTWDDSYHYIQKRNPKYISGTYLIDSIFDNKFSSIIMLDLVGELLFAQDYDLQNRKFIPPSPHFLKDIQLTLFKINPHAKTNKPFAGIYCFNNIFYFFSLNPILPGSGLGSPNGYLLFFRKIDDDSFKRYERIMKFKLFPSVIEQTDLTDKKISYTKSETEIIAEISLPGVLKRSHLSIKMPMPRNIYLYGKKTFIRYIALIAILAYLCVFLMYKLFDKYILHRILNLKKELNQISEEYSQISRVSACGDDEIGKLGNNINSTLDALDQKQLIINRASKLSALGEMAASVAHEINNPLTIISGYSKKIAEQIESNEFNKEVISKNARKIIATVLRIEKIIKSLRVISRDGEQDQMTVTTIGSIFEDVYSLCLAKIKENNIKMDFSEFSSAIQLEARPVQIAQVLINLISNAIDAIEHNPDPWIKVKSEETENEILISVSDSGKQIPDEVAHKIMSPFFTTKAPGKGTGLGLSISKKIVESHGGQLILETTPHTCFTVILPKSKAR